MSSTIVLCRTPFQAIMMRLVLSAENIKQYDVIYYTQSDSEEDRCYFEGISCEAERSQYVYVKPSYFDIIGYIRCYLSIYSFIANQSWENAILASFDNFVFNRIVTKQVSQYIITVDDGTGNLYPSSGYRDDDYQGRGKIYRLLFGASKLVDFRTKISRHYTIYPQFDNIIEQERIRVISSPFKNQEKSNKDGKVVFFIGQPFRDILTTGQITQMIKYLRGIHIDFYVKHPRETKPLAVDIPLLDKKGLIAEEAIFRECQGKKPVIIGFFSTVMFNISSADAEKIMITFQSHERNSEFKSLGQSVGCTILEFGG